MMNVKLAELVMRETGVMADHVMLLRHASDNIKKLLELGGTVENYTFVQPIGNKYDYYDRKKPRIDVVIVIVGDKVYGVYEVLGIAKEGTNFALASPALRQFDINRGKPEVAARLYNMIKIASAADGKTITGWQNRQRTPVQRVDGRFFEEILVVVKEAGYWESLASDLIEIAEQSDVPLTTREALIAARVGQGQYRTELLAKWSGACAATGCVIGEILRASHCKPWCKSTSHERLDADNGLLLIATLDALFDAGLITFDAEGNMMVSPLISIQQQRRLGLPSKLIRRPNRRQAAYLAYHSAHVFRDGSSR